MNHFYIITNGHKDYNLEKTNEIRKYLEKCGKKCTVQVKEPGKEQGYTDAAQIPEDVDCILVLGGDGTLLQAGTLWKGISHCLELTWGLWDIWPR